MDEHIDVTFSSRYRPLPEGYRVTWDPHVSCYVAHGPDDWEEGTTDRYEARRWCFHHARYGCLEECPICGRFDQHTHTIE